MFATSSNQKIQLELLASVTVLALIVAGCLVEVGHCGGAPRQPLLEPELEADIWRAASGRNIVSLFQNVRSKFRAPKIFNYTLFKEKYHKSHGSAVEEMVRMRKFLARSYDVVVKAVKYYHKQIGYYTTINESSDLLDEELEARRNKFLAPESDDQPPVDHGARPKSRRSKRDVTGMASAHDDGENHENHESDLKARYREEQNFRKLNVFSTRDGHRRNYSELPVKSQHKTHDFGLMFGRWLFGDDWTPSWLKSQVERAPAADDVVWVDHRRSKCLQPVGNQRSCGSCFAFAMLAFLEWAHCKETGQLVKFSEQYVLDCGSMVSTGIFGCGGGRYFSASEFVANFGFELASTYPYKAKSSVCPYESRTSIDAMGHLKATELADLVGVELAVAEDYLEHAPMLINMQCEGDFEFYAGGVFDGRDCRERRFGDHAMLLVGHGREDDEEYWLIRNSFGAAWGEDGHMKLNKNSHCIHPAEGLVLGSRDAKGVKLGLRVNEKMPRPFSMVTSPLAFALRTVPFG